MSKADYAGASDHDESGLPGKSVEHNAIPDLVEETLVKDALAEDVLVNDDIARREKSLLDDEVAILGRENSATAREDAAHSREDAATVREDAAQLREGEATSREGEIRVAKQLQAASDEHIIILKQANTQLVIATIEAQKLAEQLEVAQIQLERAKSVAEKANHAKSDFLSSMSHELRTPLNAILGFAQLMESGAPPPTVAQNGNIAEILKAGWYLLDLIDQLLDLTVIESGKLPVSLEPVSLLDIMRECEALTGPQAQQRNIRITFFPIDADWFAHADRTRIKQVMINLLSNAIKYNREHGTVEVRCTAYVPGRMRISVKDSGAGLSSENMAQLFQPFNRLGQEGGTEQGTGIGLVVARQLVELMDGRFGVESTVGKGSEFWIELNRDACPITGTEEVMAEEPIRIDDVARTLRTLLYVEDNPSNLLLIAQIVAGQAHMRMLSASDGKLGLELARAYHPDAILLDINLRGISGFEVLKALQDDPLTTHIPVLAISANAMQHDIDKGLQAGFVHYITKPIKVTEFVAALNSTLRPLG